ncbi:MAG: prepilin-type N-terminal cleavage/methylation domain-containing protein [Candidatus Dojkabacteria bacterium]
MNRNKKLKSFSLVEVLLAMTLLGIIMMSLAGALGFGQESSLAAGNTARASLIADEGVEAVDNIADEDFANLVDGTYGLAVSGGVWTFSGTSDTTDIFERVVTISTVDTYTKQVTSEVTWSQGAGQLPRVVTVDSYVSDWSRLVVTSNSTFRATEYYLGTGVFSGNSYSLTLNQDLESNYFVIVQGSDGNGSRRGTRGPDENYVSLTADPFGTGALGTSGGTAILGFTRQNSVNSWVGVVTVVECLGDCNASGFELLDVERVTHSGTATSGSVTTTSWSDIGQVMLMGGFNGSGCDTTQTRSFRSKVCHVRMYPSGSNTVNWTRNSGGASLRTATSTTMVVEWGSEWTIQRANVTGNNGGNGADATGEYSNGAISGVARDNTWVWGTGHTNDQGIGDAAEGVLVTLGDGVNQNGTETQVSVGMEYGGNSMNFEVYALTHPDLAVDYRFKADGHAGNLTLDTTVDSASDVDARMALIYNGQNGTGNAYPRPHFSARYINNTTVRAERRRTGQNWPAWIQGINFSAITYSTGGGGTGDWSAPLQQSQINLAGNENALGVRVQGNYAYVVRDIAGTNFVVVDISNLSTPLVVGSLSLPDKPTSVAVGSAYVGSKSNSGELQIVDVSTPSSPSHVGTYNAAGDKDAKALTVDGTTVYLVKKKEGGGDELFIINVSIPASPSLISSLELGDEAKGVVKIGNYLYIGNKSNSQELQVIDVTTPATPSIAGSLDLSGNDDPESIDGAGSMIILGRRNDVYVIDISTPTSPTVLGSFNAGGKVKGVSYHPSSDYIFLATENGSQEFQVVDISSPASITLVGGLNVSGKLKGIDYSPGLDRAFGASDSNSEEFIIFQPQ